jgi:hypothetical protein
MKLLLLEFTHRNFLLNRCALKLDADGNETLTGLSELESVFYLQMFDDVVKGLFLVDIEKIMLFLSTHERHITQVSI